MWLLRVNGQKADIEDFLPYAERKPVEDTIATPQDVLGLLKAIARQKPVKTK